MRKLVAFNHVSLDGYFVDSNGDMSWAKGGWDDPEWNAFVAQNASGNGPLIFGRVTYELMVRYWPTPVALEQNPVMAERMNKLQKFVFSRTLGQVSWSNTTLLQGELVSEVRRLKSETGEGIAILGSGTIVSQLAGAGLIDEFQAVVNPIVLGQGRTMFDGIKEKLKLKLIGSRAFNNGNIYLRYEPAT